MKTLLYIPWHRRKSFVDIPLVSVGSALENLTGKLLERLESLIDNLNCVGGKMLVKNVTQNTATQILP